MAIVIVERTFGAPVVFDELEALETRASWCLEAHRVRAIRSWLSADGLFMVCEYEAPDAESVRLAQEKAQLPFERVWAAVPVTQPGGAFHADSNEGSHET